MNARRTSESAVAVTADAPRSSAEAPPFQGPAWLRALDRVLAVQRKAVLTHVHGIRRRHPDATPAELVRILERHYLTAVTSGGAAVGATAMVPAVGTGVTLALSGAETVGFLEATALFAQSVTEVHGITLDDPTRARALVMTLMLGPAGTDLLRQFGAQVAGTGPARTDYWGEMITASLPQLMMGPVADELKRRFVKKFAVSHGTSLIGKAIPFGIGAAIGGVGNNLAGRQVVRAARTAFGPPPLRLRPELEAAPRAPRSRGRLSLPRLPFRSSDTLVIEEGADGRLADATGRARAAEKDPDEPPSGAGGRG